MVKTEASLATKLMQLLTKIDFKIHHWQDEKNELKKSFIRPK